MVTRRWVLCVNSCRQLLTRSSWKRGKAATDTPRASWQFWDGHKLSLSFGIHCLTTFVHPAPFQFLSLAWRHIFSARHLTHVIYTDETICLRISPLLVGVIMLTLNILLLLLLLQAGGYFTPNSNVSCPASRYVCCANNNTSYQNNFILIIVVINLCENHQWAFLHSRMFKKQKNNVQSQDLVGCYFFIQ